MTTADTTAPAPTATPLVILVHPLDAGPNEPLTYAEHDELYDALTLLRDVARAHDVRGLSRPFALYSMSTDTYAELEGAPVAGLPLRMNWWLPAQLPRDVAAVFIGPRRLSGERPKLAVELGARSVWDVDVADALFPEERVFDSLVGRLLRFLAQMAALPWAPTVIPPAFIPPAAMSGRIFDRWGAWHVCTPNGLVPALIPIPQRWVVASASGADLNAAYAGKLGVSAEEVRAHRRHHAVRRLSGSRPLVDLVDPVDRCNAGKTRAFLPGERERVAAAGGLVGETASAWVLDNRRIDFWGIDFWAEAGEAADRALRLSLFGHFAVRYPCRWKVNVLTAPGRPQGNPDGVDWAELAASSGVVLLAPALPVWSDEAGAFRHPVDRAVLYDGWVHRGYHHARNRLQDLLTWAESEGWEAEVDPLAAWDGAVVPVLPLCRKKSTVEPETA